MLLLFIKTDQLRSRMWRGLIVLAFVLGATSLAMADIVIEWNAIATTIGSQSGQSGMPQTRAYAMTHAAIHDALNAIDRRYKPYAYARKASPDASPAAAVATAAHDVLAAVFPNQKDAFDAAYQTSLAAIPNGNAKTLGIATGGSAAAAILALRNNDGSATAQFPYVLPVIPGLWQPTPPAFLVPNFPGWGNVTPFRLNHGTQFRPDPSEELDPSSAAYAAEYREVKAIGDINSPSRTSEQSQIAQFWYEGSMLGWNRIARIVSAEKAFGVWENARFFALLNFARYLRLRFAPRRCHGRNCRHSVSIPD
jgi:hypothetical protein